MKSKKVKCHLHHLQEAGASSLIILDKKIVHALRIPIGRPIWLTIGSKQIKVIVQPHARQQLALFPSNIMHLFGMHDGLSLRVRFDESHSALRFGPLVAVLLQSAGRVSSPRVFGEMTPFCRELAAAAQREGVWLSVMTPQSVKRTEKSMIGWTWRRYWSRTRLPLPDVIYNRLQTRKAEQSASVQTLLRHIKQHFNTAIFNEQFLDKISVFAALNKDETARKHIPHSAACHQMSVVRAMLAKYPVVFLKPATGSMGRGIIRISRRGDQSYTAQFTHLNNTSRQVFADSSALMRYLTPRLKRKPHLVQQGLSLLTVQRHNLDFRVLVQKDKSGAWDITSMAARIAAPRHFVSNLARGGRLTTALDALLKARIQRKTARDLVRQMRLISIQVATAMEKQMSGTFGELGVDLAIDQQHRIWLLEVNSKPSKIDTQMPTAGKIRPSARKVIQYSTHLGGF